MLQERLKKLRKDKKLTQEELADKLGMVRSTYSNYESGKREPDLKTIQMFSDFFGVSFDYLVGEKNKNPGQESEQAGEYITDKQREIINMIKAFPESDLQLLHQFMERLKK